MTWAPSTRQGEIGPFVLVFFTSRENDIEDFIFFPVAPSDMKAQYGHVWNDFEIANLGEAALRGGDKLANMTFDSFFPRDYDPGYVDGFYAQGFGLKAPWEYEQLIHRIRQVGRPCQLIIGGTNINWTCDIRDFRVEHRNGEPGDIYFSIDLKKHRYLTVERRKADTSTPPPQQSTVLWVNNNIPQATAKAKTSTTTARPKGKAKAPSVGKAAKAKAAKKQTGPTGPDVALDTVAGWVDTRPQEMVVGGNMLMTPE